MASRGLVNEGGVARPTTTGLRRDRSALGETTVEGVTEHLRSAIHRGDLNPGDWLPAERQMADELGIARMTLRSALRKLQDEGYLATRRGSTGGTYVTELAAPARRWERSMVVTPEAVGEILDYRIVLDRGAAFLAAQRRRPQDLAAMRRSIKAMSEADDLARYRRADSAFHRALSTAARNRRLADEIQAVRGALFFPVDALRFELAMETVEEHQVILEAVADRDGPLAADLAEAHAESTREQIRRMLKAGASRRPHR
jgi:GntR family transcriptional repressor for pyruvate dehydrogenase complex